MAQNPRGPHRTPLERAEALTKLQFMNIVDVAEEYNVCVATVRNWQHQFENDGTYTRQPGTGQWKITTPQEDQILLNYVHQHPFRPLTRAVRDTHFPTGMDAARVRVKESGLGCFVARQRDTLLPRHRADRLQYANTYVGQPDHFWSNVGFMDEKVWSTNNDGHMLVYRPRGTRNDEQYAYEKRHSGRISVAVWAWLSSQGVGGLRVIERNMNSAQYCNILGGTFIPQTQQRFPGQRVKFVHRNNLIEQLPHTAKSPDLNPTEHLWSEMVRYRKMEEFPFPDSAEELLVHILEMFDMVTPAFCNKICRSMPHRLQEVIARNGFYTSY
ncbi:hypothetical protein B566_EDAN017057 [Ephemera danica]|nr:hypothetical protein B566_EDAN017057 [Ephemera danica]